MAADFRQSVKHAPVFTLPSLRVNPKVTSFDSDETSFFQFLALIRSVSLPWSSWNQIYFPLSCVWIVAWSIVSGETFSLGFPLFLTRLIKVTKWLASRTFIEYGTTSDVFRLATLILCNLSDEVGEGGSFLAFLSATRNFNNIHQHEEAWTSLPCRCVPPFAGWWRRCWWCWWRRRRCLNFSGLV